MSELIYVSPPAAEVEPLEGKVRAVLADLPLTALDIRTVRIGRTWEIMAQAQLRPDIDLDAHAADDYREKLAGQFAHERQAVRAVLIFTYLPTEPLT